MRLRVCARLSYAGLLAIALFAAQKMWMLTSHNGQALDVEELRQKLISNVTKPTGAAQRVVDNHAAKQAASQPVPTSIDFGECYVDLSGGNGDKEMLWGTAGNTTKSGRSLKAVVPYSDGVGDGQSDTARKGGSKKPQKRKRKSA